MIEGDIKKSIKTEKKAAKQKADVTAFVSSIVYEILEKQVEELVKSKLTQLYRIIEDLKANVYANTNRSQRTVHEIDNIQLKHYAFQLDQMIRERKELMKIMNKSKKILREFIELLKEEGP